MKNLVKLTAVVVCMAAVMLTACGGNGANKCCIRKETGGF